MLLLKYALISLSSLSLCSSGNGIANIRVTLGSLVKHALNAGIYSHGHLVITSPIHVRMHILSLLDRQHFFLSKALRVSLIWSGCALSNRSEIVTILKLILIIDGVIQLLISLGQTQFGE